MVVLVLRACEDTKDPHAYQIKKGMLDKDRIKRVVQNLNNLPSRANDFGQTVEAAGDPHQKSEVHR